MKCINGFHTYDINDYKLIQQFDKGALGPQKRQRTRRCRSPRRTTSPRHGPAARLLRCCCDLAQQHDNHDNNYIGKSSSMSMNINNCNTTVVIIRALQRQHMTRRDTARHAAPRLDAMPRHATPRHATPRDTTRHDTSRHDI